MRKRCGLTHHRSNGHCEVRSLNHRVKCDYSVQRIVASTNNLTASKHVTTRNHTCVIIRWKLRQRRFWANGGTAHLCTLEGELVAKNALCWQQSFSFTHVSLRIV